MNKYLIAKILNFTGIFVMISVIILMIPLSVPKVLGYQLYGVLSESMTPAYSVGGVVYVKKCDPNVIEVGDVITFSLESNMELVMTHRVVSKDDGKRIFVTKGDANNVVDAEPVQYSRVLGTVRFYLPYVSGIAKFINSVTGKAFLFILFAFSFIFWLAADLINPSNIQKKNSKKTTRNKHRAIKNLGIFFILVASAYLGLIFWNYAQSNSEYSTLNENVILNGIKSDSTDLENANSEDDLRILEAVKNLHEENKDVIGWIMFDSVDISYPIMQCDNNTYYLNHTFSGNKNRAGSIFMEASNSSDYNDCHTILYGHNMKNKTMFGALRKYRTPNFYKDHQYFTIYTLNEVYHYQIFAFYDIDMYADLYTIGFEPDSVFEEFISKMLRKSYENTNVSVSKDDKIITLSTCSSKGNRFVVNAKRVDEKQE